MGIIEKNLEIASQNQKKNLIEKLSLSSENISRKKPINFDENDEKLFKHEFTRFLPIVFPIIKKKSFVSNCSRLMSGIFFNPFQFSTDLKLIWLTKLYLKFFFYLTKIRKVKKFDKILFITNSNSPHNFFHWNLDVLQKLEFIEQNKDEISSYDLKIIIPNDHISDYIKNTLEAFDINLYYQKKNEIIFANSSILLPDIAPTGNFREEIIRKLNLRMRNHWINKKNIDLRNQKRIYISRKNAPRRRLVNEAEIINILKKHDFSILDFDELNFEEQLKNILNCEVLVGSHGSALSHMLWMKPKSKIIEIRTKNNSNDNCFFSLASALDHDYYYMMADKNNPKRSFHLSDIIIDVNYFSSQLSKML